MCEILEEYENENDITIFAITTENPIGIESLDGLSRFKVLAEQIILV